MQSFLQLLRSGSQESKDLKALLRRAKPSTPTKQPTSPPSAAGPGKPASGTKTGRWRNHEREDGWVTIKTKKAKTEKADGPRSGDTLLQEGISVPVKASFAEMSTNDSGICLCSAAEAKRALDMMWSDKPAAVLSPVNIEGRGIEKDILVRDKEGRVRRRPRYVFQLGAGAVEFNRIAPQARVQADSVRMIVNMHEDSTEDWKSVMKDPVAKMRGWLRERAKANVLETRPPTRLPGEPGLQALVYVSLATAPAVLRASGAAGVFTRDFYESDEDRQKYRTVPCQEGCSLKAALEQAGHMGNEAYGVVRTKRGFAIRVKATEYEGVVRRLRPEDAQHFIGDRWEISGLPVTTGKEAVQEFVSGWAVHPLFSFRQGWRRTWVVRAASAPDTRLIEHQAGYAVIQEYQPRHGKAPTERERWQPPKGPPSLCTSAFPALKSAAGGPRRLLTITSERPTAENTPMAEENASLAEPGLEERIARAVAAAMAPITAQIAALRSSTAATAEPDAPMAGNAAEEAPAASLVPPAAVEAPAPAAHGAETAAVVQAAARTQMLGAPPASYADRSSSAPYSSGG